MERAIYYRVPGKRPEPAAGRPIPPEARYVCREGDGSAGREWQEVGRAGVEGQEYVKGATR
jgi:hypothetical protein